MPEAAMRAGRSDGSIARKSQRVPPTGESRKFLEDGDEVILRGWCEAEGARRIGLGECAGIVVGASVASGE